MKVTSNPLFLRATFIAVCACLSALQAHAAEGDSPLFLTLSHDVSRDSNFSRDARNLEETVNTSSLKFGIDKAYGRQNYNLATKITKSSYSKFSELNNEGKDLAGSVSTEMLSDWLLKGYGLYSESLNPIQNNATENRVVRNVKRYRNGGFTVQYGAGRTWGFLGAYDSNRIGFSESTYDNSSQNTRGLKLVYNSSDLLSFSLGLKNRKTEYVNRASLVQNDKDMDFGVEWQATGLSSLSAVLTRRSTSYNQDGFGESSGWNGNLSWQYTPSGLTTYTVSFYRATGSDRQVVGFSKASGSVVSLADTISTTLDLGVNYQLTDKFGLRAGHNITQYKQDNSLSIVGNSANSSGWSHATSLTANYAALRSLSFECSYTTYSQTLQASSINGTAIRPMYDGHSVNCNANFTLRDLTWGQ